MRSLSNLLRPLAPLLPGSARRMPAGLDGTTIEVPSVDGPIAVLVHVRPNARRMILKIDRQTRAPALTLPRGVGRVRAERFLADHVGWIAERLRRMPAQISLGDGAVIPFRGTPTRISHQAPFRGVTRLEPGAEMPVLVVHGHVEGIPGRVLRFLRAEALTALTAASQHHAAKAGVSIGRISIKDTRSRWGSCSAKGDLSFSWRLILAPPFVLDYLAAHEVAHRLEMNHSTRYWRHVRVLCPDYPAAEAWLKHQGPLLHQIGL